MHLDICSGIQRLLFLVMLPQRFEICLRWSMAFVEASMDGLLFVDR